MPRIENASHLKLTNIVDQLTSGGAPDTQHVGSEGNDLYVNDGVATPSSSPRDHHRQAVKLVCGCLAEDFNTTAENAQQILTNVFGQVPTRMTVCDLKRLRDLGGNAAALIATGHDAVEAFTRAQAPKEAPKSAPSPALPPVTTTVSVPEKRKEAAEPTFEEVRKWLPDLHPFNMGDSVMLAYSIATGMLAPDQARFRISSRGMLEGYCDTLIKLIKLNLPSYASSTPEQQKAWINIARAMSNPGLFFPDRLKNLTTDQKLSVQHALADHYKTLVGHKEMIPEQAAIVRASVMLNKTYQLSELIPPKEKNTMDALFSDIGNNQILGDAYVHWGTMDETQRKEVIQTLIDLHAEKFGYTTTKPALTFKHGDDSNSAGSFNEPENTLIVFTSHKDFNTFAHPFNVVIHELTHKYQHELVARMNAQKAEPDAPQHAQARYFDANERFYVVRDVLTKTLGFSQDEATRAYRSNLMELHAFHWGDLAAALLRKIFTPQASTGEIK